ncbi:hypothetical protein Agub_g2955 [Astrephomene gubernaculifera]|uniref:Uncharacterized protein n=1 Tax=Astrephomene gubernaculifera TaxID=47775 RepID=A0AAD3HIH9_9CHLO|nr:hypothetical protein Agub_g2955 [Astrephomene gubernaculifera]
MTRLSVGLLSRLGHVRGSSLPASSAFIDGLDTAAVVGDGCSTSFAPAAPVGVRAYAGTTNSNAKRYNFIQPVDTNKINALLESATLLEHAAVPVLKYGAWFDPEQVTRTLQRVPRMVRYQRRKGKRASPGSPAATAPLLLDALGSRLAQVAPDCSDEQLARALWAYGVSRHPNPAALLAACEQLPRRLPSMPLTHLATAAWGLAAAASAPGSSSNKQLQDAVRETLATVARHLAASRPESFHALPPPAAAVSDSSSSVGAGSSRSRSLAHQKGSSSSSGRASASSAPLQPAAEVVAAAAGRSALEADRPWLDHRSALKLAWAFATADVRDAQALDVIGDAAAARIASQLQSHDPALGPLAPRATYLYRTIRGWQAWPRPRPPRAGTAGARSRYLYDERPRVVLRDFTLGSLAPLLACFGRLGHRHEGLLKASAQHVVASAGPSLCVHPHDLTRLTGALHALRSPQPQALAALLGRVQLTDLPAPVLARLTLLAADWGVAKKALYGRLVRQLAARAWVVPAGGVLAAKDAAEEGGVAAPVVYDENAAKGAEGKVEEEGLEVRLDARARVAGGLRSWQANEALLARQGEEWARVRNDPRDRVEAEELAKLLMVLGKVGYDERDSHFARALFAAVLPRLPNMRRDAVADLALAAVHFAHHLDGDGDASDSSGSDSDSDSSSDSSSSSAAAASIRSLLPVPGALDLLRDCTNVVLYGSATGARVENPDLRRRLFALAGYGSRGSSPAAAAAAEANDDAQAADLRTGLGLSAGGALRLAQALTARPEAVQEKELRAVLALVDTQGAGRKQLGELVSKMRQRGREGVLPPRLLAACGEQVVSQGQLGQQ